MTVAVIPDLSAILGWGHSDLSVSTCVNRTFQRRDSCWACWTFACYQELRVKWRELIFCLLEVHSLGLGRSLARLPCRMLSPSSSPPPPTSSSSPTSVSLSLCLSAWQLSSSWHLSCRYWERCSRRAAEAAIDLPPLSPHKLHIKEGGWGGGKKYRQPPPANNAWYGEGIRRRNVDSLACGGRGNCCTLLRHNSQSRCPRCSHQQWLSTLLMIGEAYTPPPPPPNKKHWSEYL